MIRRPTRSTRTYTRFPYRRSSDLEGVSQHAVAVITGDAGVERGGRAPTVAGLLLDEDRVEAVLAQMGHVGVPQTVRVQHRVQAEVVAPVGELAIDVGQPDTSLASVRLQHRRVRQFEPRQI